MNPEELQKIIAPWAVNLPFPVRVYFFGSRLNGNPKPESDMDIAVQVLLNDVDRNSRRNMVFDIENSLYSLLNKATALPVHVVFYDGNQNSKVGMYLKKGHEILYQPQEHQNY